MFKKLLKSVFNSKTEELHNETPPKEDSSLSEERTDLLCNPKNDELKALDSVKSIVNDIVDQLPLDNTSKGSKEEKEEISEEKSANSSYTTALNSTYEADDELSKRLNDLLGKVEWEDKETEETIQTPSNTKDYFDNSAQNTVTKLEEKSEDLPIEIEPLEQPKFDEDPADMSEEKEVSVQRGTYTIDWDNLDAFDPFGGNPSTPKKNITNNTNDTVVEKNIETCEIQPSSHSSPPCKDDNKEDNHETGQVNNNENRENEVINNNEQLNGKVENNVQNNSDNENKTENTETVKEKQTTKPKKSTSRFKRPAKPFGGFQQTDDIVIFASKSEKKNFTEETNVEKPLPTNENVIEKEEPVKDDENNIISNVANIKNEENNSQEEESFDGNQTLKETSAIQMNTSDEDRIMMPPPPSDFLTADESEEFTPCEAWQEDAFELLEKAGGHQTDNLSALAKESLFIRFDPLLQDVASPLLKERARKAAEALREEAAKQDKAKGVEDREHDLMSMSSPAGVGDATFVRNKKAPVSKNLLSQFGDSNTQSQQTGSMCTSWLSSVSQYNERDMLSSRDSLEESDVTENTITQSKSDDSGAIVATPNGLSQADIDRVRQEVMLEMKGDMLAQTKDYESKLEEYRKKEQEWDQVTEYQYNVLTNLTNALEAKDAEVLQAAEDVQRFERALGETTSLYSELKIKYQDASVKNISLTEQLRELQILLQERMNKYDILTEEADDKVNQVEQDFEALESDKNKEIELLMKKIRMMEMKESSLQNELAQKKKDLDELARICDELISKGRTS